MSASLSDQDRKVLRTASRTHSPFQFLKSASEYFFLESYKRYNADSAQESIGWLKFKASGFVFLAFWVESYLNYSLQHLYSGVEYVAVERLSTKKKAELIAEKLGIDFSDYKCTVNELFNFRNSLAHGKTEILGDVEDSSWTLAQYNNGSAASILGDYEDLDAQLELEWESYLKKDNSLIEQKLAEILERFYETGSFEFHPLGSSDFRSFSASVGD